MKSLADGTADKVFTTFAAVERLAKPAKLQDLTADRLSKWFASLQNEDRKGSTVAGYIRHLKASLNWGRNIGLLNEVPAMVTPKGAASQGMKGRPIVGEEHWRMQPAVGKVVEAPYVPL